MLDCLFGQKLDVGVTDQCDDLKLSWMMAHDV